MMNNNLNNGGTMCFSKVGLTAGTTSTYTTTVATDFIINGKFGTQFGTQTNQATPTTDHVTGAAFPALAINQGVAIVFGTIAAGTVVAMQGDIKSLDTSAAEFVIAPPFPAVPSDVAVFGYVIVTNDSTGSAWTFGTSNWTATGIVDTFVDVAMLPDRPQES
jgi:hypothetical protein